MVATIIFGRSINWSEFRTMVVYLQSDDVWHEMWVVVHAVIIPV